MVCRLQIYAALGQIRANSQRELNRMAEGKFLIVTKKGKTKIYQTNKQFPILKELQSIVIKSQKGSKPSKTIG